MRIFAFDEIDFPIADPMLEGFFALDGVIDIAVRFVVNEHFDAVLGCKF